MSKNDPLYEAIAQYLRELGGEELKQDINKIRKISEEQEKHEKEYKELRESSSKPMRIFRDDSYMEAQETVPRCKFLRWLMQAKILR